MRPRLSFPPCATAPTQLHGSFDHRSHLANDFRYLSGCRTVPFFWRGRVAGFKYFPSKEIAAETAIRPGDIVHTLNNLPITTPDNALRAYQELKSAKSIAALVTRKGRYVCLNIRMVRALDEP